MTKVRYEEMRPGELDTARKRTPLVYVPIGSLEYHGLHLPVGLDTMHAHVLCLAAAEQTGGVVLPPTFWATRGHEGFPGSLLLQPETIANLMRDVLDQLIQQGYKLIVVCTGHWPEVQGKLLRQVAEEQIAATPLVRVMVVDPFNLHPTDPRVDHAGHIETSAALHLWPDLVDMNQLKQPDAMHAISRDCVEATASQGRTRFNAVLEAMVKTVNETLAQ